MSEFSDDVCPTNREAEAAVIRLELTIDEQRKWVSAEAGGPVFRMWITREEFERGSFADWTAYELRDGRLAIWRPEADLLKLKKAGEFRLLKAIEERRLPDDVV
jgi:hypothetical protein